jgi:predicted permease
MESEASNMGSRQAQHYGPGQGSEARSNRTPDSWWLDVKLGFRMLVKHPGLALVGVFGIAVAVAIAAGAFSVIYGNLLSPALPLEEGDRIVAVEIWDSVSSTPERRILRDYQVWRNELKSIQEIGAFRTVTVNLIAPGKQPQSVSVASMSSAGFKVARVSPLMGRFLVEDDDRDGAPSVVVIGENVWRNDFGSDPAILGKTIQLGDSTLSIVGVMPRDFAFPVNHRFWMALRSGSALPEPLTGPELVAFGRLAPGATLESAQTELAAMGRRAALAFPESYAKLRPQVIPYASSFVGLRRAGDVTSLLLMNVITTMLLVLVCLNVAILVYARTAMRHSEISIRTALGARRSRIVAQLFIEALVLSVIGTAVGVAIAAIALRYLTGAVPGITAALPFWVSLQLSVEGVLYAAGLSVLGAAIVGIVPALKATGRRVQSGVRVIGMGGSGLKLGGTWTLLIVAQVGFAVMLLSPAVFNAWNNVQVELADPGFAAEEFLTVQLARDDVPRAQATTADTPEFARRYASSRADLLRLLEAEPRVSSATFSMVLPGAEPSALIEIEGAAATTPGAAVDNEGAAGREIRFNRVDVDLFRALGVPILAGRGFEPGDIAPADVAFGDSRDTGVVVVNQSLALRIFGGNALGRRFRYLNRDREGASNNQPTRWYEIVGIVRDFPAGVSPGMLDSELKLYHPVGVVQVSSASLALRVRGGNPTTFAKRLSEIAAAVDPNLQLRNILSMNEALRQEQWIRRLEATVLGAVSLSVLLLSSAGIYALMSFTVVQRRKEIGIRIALGADRKRIVASVFSRALGQLAIGAALGTAAAAALDSGSNLMRGNAAVVLPIVALIMMAVGLVAAVGPARRGLRIEPTEALREQ